MTKSLPSIIATLDEYIGKDSNESIGPVLANSILAKAGLLSDDKSRPGKPLRNLLRKGLLPHAYQPGGKGSSWIIPHSNSLPKTSTISPTKPKAVATKTIKVKPNKEAEVKSNNISKLLFERSRFKSASGIDAIVPDTPGLYCISIKSPNILPAPFNRYLAERKHNIMYIGIASRSLRRRFLEEELRARGHGTFFRNIGALLNKLPPKGSLVQKVNKKNYKFSATDEVFIIDWINKNLLVNWVEISGNLEDIEKELIQSCKPLINTTHNPCSLIELSQLRQKCREIACQV